ncbi:ACT domain-containing protein [Oscillospiraceae bacterium LCP25S3_E10]|nr:ACT domain-containing protein [Ruminococcus sp.]MDD6446465.1 ACT domain-containing protein [Ruminococcus sp.]MDY2856670.1 ACT domain-containing protein [Oscillospiraceae bacterium]
MSAKIQVSNDITLVTLRNAPADMDFIASVFEDIAALNIDIDMISLSPVQGSSTSVSFTINDDDLMPLLGYTSKLKSKNIKPIVSSGNSIISLMDDDMADHPGVASKIFRAIADSNIDLRIVTTSQVQVSVLVTDAVFEQAYKALSTCLDS